MSKRVQLPSSLDGSLTPYLSKARIREQFADVDAMLGGTERLYHEANRDPEAYRWFKTLQVKLEPKESLNELSVSSGMESLLRRVEERKKARLAQIIDVTPTPIPTAEYVNATEGQPDEGSAPVQHHGGDQGGEEA